MDRFEDMRCFRQVAEFRSVTRAAEAMNLAPSAVSRRLKDLEARLGAQLLARSTRRMSLTEAGEVFFRRCQQILADLDEAEAEASDRRHGLRGQFRLAAPLSFGVWHLTPVLSDFMAEHPELRIDLDLSDRLVDLVGESFDLAVRIGSLRDSSLVARRLGAVRMIACAAPSLLARIGEPAEPEDLRALPALCYAGSERADIWRWRDGAGRERSVQVPMRLRATNGEALTELAAAGHGVVLQPSFIVQRALAEGRLVPVLRATDWTGIAIHVVYPGTRHLPARARAFIDFAQARFAAGPGWEAAATDRG